jgi:ribosome-binding factor A
MRLHRKERLGSLIREELALMIAREIELPGVLPTITDVVVDDDHSHATVRVSFFPSDTSERSLKIIQKELPRFEHMLWKKLGVRPMPHLTAHLDRGPENAARVEKALLEDGIESSD